MRPGKPFTIAAKVVVTGAVAVGLSFLTFCGALAGDIAVSERTFGRILHIGCSWGAPGALEIAKFDD
jgi:hypothetical protein